MILNIKILPVYLFNQLISLKCWIGCWSVELDHTRTHIMFSSANQAGTTIEMPIMNERERCVCACACAWSNNDHHMCWSLSLGSRSRRYRTSSSRGLATPLGHPPRLLALPGDGGWRWRGCPRRLTTWFFNLLFFFFCKMCICVCAHSWSNDDHHTR